MPLWSWSSSHAVVISQYEFDSIECARSLFILVRVQCSYAVQRCVAVEYMEYVGEHTHTHKHLHTLAHVRATQQKSQ